MDYCRKNRIFANHTLCRLVSDLEYNKLCICVDNQLLWLDNKNQARYITPLGRGGKDCILTSPINISDYNNDFDDTDYRNEYTVSFAYAGVAYYNDSPFLPTPVEVVSMNAIIGTLYINIPYILTQDFECEIELYAKVSGEYICIAKQSPVVHVSLGQGSTLPIPYQYFNYTDSPISMYFKLRIASATSTAKLTIANTYFQIDSGIVG